MCVYVCVCMCAYVCMSVCLCVCMYVCMCACVCLCVCVCLSVCVCVHVSLSVCTCMCVCVCLYVCICVYECMCVYLCVCLSVYMCVCMCVCLYVCVRAHSVLSDSLQPYGLQPARLLCLWNFPGKNIGVSCHFLLQGIFPAQGLTSKSLAFPALAGRFFTTVPPGKSSPNPYIALRYSRISTLVSYQDLEGIFGFL